MRSGKRDSTPQRQNEPKGGMNLNLGKTAAANYINPNQSVPNYHPGASSQSKSKGSLLGSAKSKDNRFNNHLKTK
jgi:hypothetical protein